MASFLLFLAVLPIVGSLHVSSNNLYHGSKKVFLSGMNLAWKNYGDDFGRNRYHSYSKSTLLGYLDAVQSAGGNSVRVFLHGKGKYTPRFTSGGYTIATDSHNSMKYDLARGWWTFLESDPGLVNDYVLFYFSFLDSAKERNIMVFITLWDGAVTPDLKVRNLFWDLNKLRSYINNALIPLVTHLKDKPALGGWDIINEPEGLVYPNRYDATPCFNTQPMGNNGNWASTWIRMELILRFINLQAAAIKDVSSNMLTTVGAWSEISSTDNFGYRNYYKDSCLTAAGGDAAGKLDFYQIHSYAHNEGNKFNTYSPLKKSKSVFGLDKPVVIGELSEDGGDGTDIEDYMDHAYTKGYSGAWTWQANGSGANCDDLDTQEDGVSTLDGRNNPSQGGLVNFAV